MSDGRTIRFATVALLTGVAAFFAVRAWGFGERLETGAIAQIDQKDHTGAAISPFGAQLIGFRRSGLKLTVWTWALEAGKVRNQRAIDLAPQDGDAESPPFAISQDASRIAWPGSRGGASKSSPHRHAAPSAWTGPVRSPVLRSLIRTIWMDLRGPRHGAAGPRVSYERCGKYVVNKLESIYV